MSENIIIAKENLLKIGNEKEKLKIEQRHYERRLEEENADPLLPWVEYINWLEGNEGSSVGKYLKKTLGKCISKLMHEDRYKQDERFVRICVKYALHHEETIEYCATYLASGIGTNSAYLYLVCAEKYCLDGKYRKANKTFEKGINEGAQPLELLQNGQKNFHDFLVKKMLTSNEVFKPTSSDLKKITTIPKKNPLGDVQDNVNNQVKTVVESKPAIEKVEKVVTKNEYNEFNVNFSLVPLYIEEPYEATKKAMYNKDKVYADGTEYQFEEIRAVSYFKKLEEQKLKEKTDKKKSKLSAGISKMSSLKKVPDSARKNAKSETKSARKKLQVDKVGEFGGVVRKSLAFGKSAERPLDTPSDSFINQTINTKEAYTEMQQLWFAKPSSPAPTTFRNTKSVFNPDRQTDVATSRRKTMPDFSGNIPIYVDESCIDYATKPKSSNIPIYVDESCLDGIRQIDSQNVAEDLRKVKPHVVAEASKENSAPGYGKKSELVFAENRPPCPFTNDQDEDDDEDDGNISWPCVPCNTTGITETCNFTQAFQANRITLASTPNTKRIAGNVFANKASSPQNSDFMKDTCYDKVEDKKRIEESPMHDIPKPNITQPFNPLNSRKLSTIVETSREYKSSSSSAASCTSTVSKFTTFTPKGPSEETYRKTPFSCKTQSTYGYEASSEYSTNHGAAFSRSDFNEPKNAIDFTLPPKVPNNEKVDIDPFDNQVTDKFLESINFPQANHVNGCNFTFVNLPNLKLHSQFSLGPNTYDVKKILGEGAYAKVLKIQNTMSGELKVAKYQKPACPWEFYIAREIRYRVPSDKLSYFMDIQDGYFFDNASLLITQPVEYGDLLTAMNLYRAKQGKLMTDYLSMYFSAQMFDILHTLHSCKIIHGDIKPDNFLIQKVRNNLQLQLIDFGRSIDMTLFPNGTEFTRVVKTEGFTCIEMQTGKSWTYQIDLYGLANCIHCLLFGGYMEVVKKLDCWEIKRHIPRYISKSWKDIFHSLLNVPSSDQIPDLEALRNKLLENLKEIGPHCDLIKLTNLLDNR